MRDPIANAEFYPGAGSLAAPPFAGILRTRQGRLQTRPGIDNPMQDGRDARLFPAVSVELFTLGDLLVPVQRGEMIRECTTVEQPSYWRVIAQIGRIWRHRTDGEWSRAAFPLTLVNDTENHAHQGLARFMYRGDEVRDLVVQFVQQTTPYLLGRHFVAWGPIRVETTPSDPGANEQKQEAALAEITARLPAKPWVELVAAAQPGALDGFGGPVHAKWQVASAIVRDGTLYYQESWTPYGPYPYPLEMRLGVRSVMKSVGVPLALLRLAQVYGPRVLELNVGDYVPGLDPKWNRIRFTDAANMATGFGGTGTFETNPNDTFDGYAEGNYDDWYTAASHAQKIAQINANLCPYPWEPGCVMRYRDQDFYLLGAALDAFVKSMRGPEADVWEMLRAEVFGPVGIQHAPAVRTREGGRDGLVWLNAGYYPTLDDLAKIALLYQGCGEHGGRQILHRQLTADLLAARNAIRKGGELFYKMGFHFIPYVGSASGHSYQLPLMWGSGENEVILYPNGLISIVVAKAGQLRDGESVRSGENMQTVRAVDRLAPF